MAKAKKSSESPASAEQNPTRSKAASRRKPPVQAAEQAPPPAQPEQPAAPTAQAPAPAPLVNPAEAAANAARMLAAKQKLQEAEAAPAAPARESASFKNLKQKLNRPGQNLSSALGNTLGHHRSNLPHHFDKQAARNQTLGGVGRFNVPRRTNG